MQTCSTYQQQPSADLVGCALEHSAGKDSLAAVLEPQGSDLAVQKLAAVKL